MRALMIIVTVICAFYIACSAQALDENQEYEVVQTFQAPLKNQEAGLHPSEIIKVFLPGDKLVYMGEKSTVKVVYRESTPGIKTETIKTEDMIRYTCKVSYLIKSEERKDNKKIRREGASWPKENEIVKITEIAAKEFIVKVK